MADSEKKSTKTDQTADENVWVYQGYRIRPGEFNTAMVHFYRGEITRSNVWRTRLDSTTNWAVVTTGAVLTFAFGSPGNSHVVILISFLLVFLFLIIEARRYRYYELWALRVRLMETDFFAAMFTKARAPHREWADHLIDSLLTPQFPISYLEAVGRRLRRNYIWLFSILGTAWAAKLALHPIPAYSFDSFIDHARVGLFSGQFVFLTVSLFLGVMIFIAVMTIGLRDSPGEVLPHEELRSMSNNFLQNLVQMAGRVLPEDLPFMRRHEQLVIIITVKPVDVSQQLLEVLNRGVTALEGKGMYSGETRSVLLCAVHPKETPRVKSLVYAVDEHAFVMVNPTEEVLGSSFHSLKPAWRKKRF